ncbi:hypothetical protein J4223_00130 [Candidatus Woesearchaeota archaeon]|nr:hypothetical protein [Candidatus Woesearchaeota archaeon]
MKYLPLILLIGCVKIQYVYVDRVIEVNNTNDIAIGIELQARCEELKQKKEDRWELFATDFYVEREELLFDVEKYFILGSYPNDLEKCLEKINY